MTETTPPTPIRGATVHDIVDELIVALVNARIYWNSHPRVSASIERLREQVRSLCVELDRDAIELLTSEDQIVFDQRPMIGASLSAPRLIRALAGRGAGGIALFRHLTTEDVGGLLQTLQDKPVAGESVEHINADLTAKGFTGVQLLAVQSRLDSEALAAARLPVRLYQGLVETLQETAISVCHGGVIDFERSQATIEDVLRSLDGSDPGRLLRAVRYERYDAYTFGHSIRVAVIALDFAKTFIDDPELLNRIGVAALLHDVGKVLVPFEVLHCRDRLDEEQRREMEKHPEYGAEILLDQHRCDPMAFAAAYGHHLPASGGGTGYPRMLRDPEVSLVTRIVRLCDVFEALTAERPYKRGMAPLRAFRIMIGMGEVLDQVLLKQFIRAIGIYPSGSHVEFEDGRRGRVVRQSTDLVGPLVELDPVEGEAEDPSEFQRLIDLSDADDAGCLGCSIRQLLDYGVSVDSAVSAP